MYLIDISIPFYNEKFCHIAFIDWKYNLLSFNSNKIQIIVETIND